MVTPTTAALPTPVRERRSADERRQEILVAATEEFARGGFGGTSTEAIARRVGISQPYLFRLFHTKRELFVATIEHCFAETQLLFEDAARGLTGRPALEAMGARYIELITTQPTKLRAQLQAYAACDDPVIRAAVGRGFEALVALGERLAGEDADVIATFFAQGMLLNVLATIGVLGSDEPWAQRLVAGCLGICA